MPKLQGWTTWMIAALLLLSVGELWAGSKKKAKQPEQFATLNFLVVREPDGKPVKNASLVIHFLREDGSQDNDGLQLKTGPDGRTSITDIPYGKLRLQAIAHGLRTYGEDVEVNAAQQEFVIRLQPPADQVSIYK